MQNEDSNQKINESETETKKRGLPSTTRKGKIAGVASYTNDVTGVSQEFNVLSVEDCDANFQKIWLSHILMAIDEIGNSKMKVLNYLLKNRYPGNNTLNKTVREIVKETGTSLQTVNLTLKALEEHNIIRRKTGVIILNPDVIFKGRHKHRMNILIEYSHFAEGVELCEEEENENVIEGNFTHKQAIKEAS
ncbi:replication/maintenance protein RepL [Chamaesiphon sp.]|uniref:replication/maintenance protein RepL n=1 Tax=Chamaesiphon sp. TaxID=2814140 RepID=UPI0035947E2D